VPIGRFGSSHCSLNRTTDFQVLALKCHIPPSAAVAVAMYAQRLKFTNLNNRFISDSQLAL